MVPPIQASLTDYFAEDPKIIDQNGMHSIPNAQVINRCIQTKNINREYFNRFESELRRKIKTHGGESFIVLHFKNKDIGEIKIKTFIFIQLMVTGNIVLPDGDAWDEIVEWIMPLHPNFIVRVPTTQ